MRVKKVYLLLFSFWNIIWVFSQKHEIGMQGGFNNLVGDVGKTDYLFAQNPLSNTSDGVPVTMMFSYKRNFNPYQGVRLEVGHGHVMYNDYDAGEKDRNLRGLYGANTVFAVDTEFIYNFFPINDEQKFMISPYVFGGLGYMIYKMRSNSSLVATDRGVYVGRMFLPFGAGLKYKFNYNWAVFGEFKFKYTFTDDLEFIDLGERKKKIHHLGNRNSNDWLNAIMLGLSYSFGRPPCDCQ